MRLPRIQRSVPTETNTNPSGHSDYHCGRPENVEPYVIEGTPIELYSSEMDAGRWRHWGGADLWLCREHPYYLDHVVREGDDPNRNRRLMEVFEAAEHAVLHRHGLIDTARDLEKPLQMEALSMFELDHAARLGALDRLAPDGGHAGREPDAATVRAATIEDFVHAAREILATVAAALGESPQDVVAIVVRRVNGRSMPPHGAVGDVAYQKHGIGCRFERGSTTIDLDISPDGSPMFDYWRFSLYAKGIGALVMSATLFEHAAGILSGRGVLTLAKPGWYSFEAKPGNDGAPGTI